MSLSLQVLLSMYGTCGGTWWKLLANRAWIRLCGDGAYRISVEGYLLVTIGFLAKGFTTEDTGRGARHCEDFMSTSFFEVAYALVNKESYTSYKRTFEAGSPA